MYWHTKYKKYKRKYINAKKYKSIIDDIKNNKIKIYSCHIPPYTDEGFPWLNENVIDNNREKRVYSEKFYIKKKEDDKTEIIDCELHFYIEDINISDEKKKILEELCNKTINTIKSSNSYLNIEENTDINKIIKSTFMEIIKKLVIID